MVEQAAQQVRINTGWLAAAEKRALVAIASRLPRWINPDHLTVLALVSMAGAGAAFWASRYWQPALVLVVVALALNWFGDSLDGTVARVRKQERPRYGFYVDHVLDLIGTTLLLVGLAASGAMTPLVALTLLIAFLLVAAEVFLATAVHGHFRMSFLNFGPTELRIVLAVGTLALFWKPRVDVFGLGTFLLFDVGGVVAACGLVVGLVASTARNTAQLYREERIRQKPSGGRR